MILAPDGRPARHSISNRESYFPFEAARQSGFRGLFYFPDLDVRSQTRRATRQSIAKKANWAYNNIGLAKSIIDRPARYVAGTGIWPTPISGDPEWDKYVKDWFDDSYRDPRFFDVAGAVSFYTAQIQILRQFDLLGDHFGQPVVSAGGQAMMRFIPGYLIDNDPAADKAGWQEGIRLDPAGRPREYCLLKSSNATERAGVLQAAEVYHFRDHVLSGQLRGLSVLSRALDHLFDIDEILQFEKSGVKISSQLGYVITTNSEGDQMPMLPGMQKETTSNVVGEDGRTTALTVGRLYGDGSVIPTLRNGEKLETLKSDRPGSTFQGFLDYLVRDIAWGSGYSPEFIWSIANVGGASNRFVLEDAQGKFEDRQQNILIPQFCQPFYQFAVWQGMRSGRIPEPRGAARWWAAKWNTPKKATLDRAKEGKLLAQLVDQGLMDPDAYHGLFGEDGHEVDMQILAIRGRRQKMVDEYNAEHGTALTVEQLFPPAPGSVAPPVPAPE